MKFTVIGHSCLRIETSGPTILVDPWLFGSCYWRSWWHYPTVAEPSPEVLAPDFVYLTHHHFDHFHFPSMRRIDRDAHVLGAEVRRRRRSPSEVRNLGFDEVMELPHAQVVQLAPGVRVASYQYGPDDTVFVVADGDDVLVDINDSKIRGRTLAADPRRVRPPDVRVQELLVRAGVPGALHRRRPGRSRADHPRHLPRRLGAAWSTSSGRTTACRSAAWSRSSTPRAAR